MILSQLLLVPLVGMLGILCLPKTAGRAIRAVATASTALTLVLNLRLLVAFLPGSGAVQFEEALPWISQLNVFYHLGVDGLSLPMVLLTTLLAFLACLASWSISERVKEYFVLYLLLEIGMLGTFLSLDLFLFYVFWEVV
ncbi:MAG: NADH-quinone oxidoreductase subunit M, partial [Candidatus Omnitrophica bacterium]|nr:NADH-quinone oxidoreductase subunit M [Candidatus Omnitrophota bacterium]